LIIVDGQKTDGIDSLLRDLRGRFTLSETVAKAHGKLFTFRPGEDLMAEWAAQPKQVEGGFQTLPGVFSADGPDAGSMLLAANRPGVKELHLVEAEAAALACARINITDPRAQFHWADATSFKLDRGVNAVVCNPPFHTTRDPDPAHGVAFLQAAARLLSGHGTLWLVANRHLPYDRPLAALFREVEDIGTDPRFRIIRAARPNRPNR
jgi:16S rRNA (guanine1207-N2)-methyltransferase